MRARSLKWMLAGVVLTGCAWASVSASPRAKTIPIVIDQIAFQQGDVTAGVGDTIEWTNKDVVDHTATERRNAWSVLIPAGKKARLEATLKAIVKAAPTPTPKPEVDPNHVYHSVRPSLSWLSPSGVTTGAITAGLVVAVFAYWGWDTAVSVNEESTNANHTPGVAAVLSTVLLLLIYLITSYGTVALLGPEFISQNTDDAIYAAGSVALPTIMVKLLVIAILTSAAASCQTTILPATRTMLSMAVHGSVPKKLAQIDRRHLSPDFSTWVFGAGSILWYLLLVIISHNTSTDAYSASIAAVGLAISVYYGLTGFSCIWYYRRYIFKSAKNFVLIGFLPLLGGSILMYVFGKTIKDAAKSTYTDPPSTLFGVGSVLVIGTGLLVLGVPVMLWCRKKYPAFFRIKPDPIETVPDPYGDQGPAAALGTYVKGA